MEAAKIQIKNMQYVNYGKSVTLDHSRDHKLTDFGKAVLQDRYLLNGESYQDMFARVATYYSDDDAHAQRLYDYMSNLWFMPATPILSNGGTNRGLPISCFLNETEDSLKGIVDLWNENVWLAARGGGIGSYWGNLRSLGESVRQNGKTSGIIPFINVQDALTLAISQGSLRRGSSAVYLPIDHPEIEEFIDIRKPTGSDMNRRTPNIHHGITISDEFMEAVAKGSTWELKSPKSRSTIGIVSARELWIKILTTRVETGEPYLIFSDNVQKERPEIYKRHDLNVKMSNLCSEITLATGQDHLGENRTAVCCLSSLNAENYEEWKDDEYFIEDVMKLLDNVLSDFIEKAPQEMKRAAYSATRERSVGMGIMGFHSFLQKKRVPIESVIAKSWNKKIFSHIKAQADLASQKLANEKGPCLDAKELGINERFTHKIAIAPTASISIICGNTSPGIEPYAANSFKQNTLTGSFSVKNKFLKEVLTHYGMDTQSVWSSITINDGSVQHLDFLSDHEKMVFKTSHEINQLWLIEHAADRSDCICQAQSLNVFLSGNVHKQYLHKVHYLAWKRGVKSMYYLRSRSVGHAEKATSSQHNHRSQRSSETQECLSCQ